MFTNRQEAGRLLLGPLGNLHIPKNALVLALPRGGVLVGDVIAAGLGADLDVLIVRKLGAPGQSELAIGAVVGGAGQYETVLNEHLMETMQVPAAYLEEETKRQLVEVERRREKYRGSHPEPRIAGRVVIVVDDGIATGATVKAALTAIRRQKPGRLILAVPVAPPDTFAVLSREVDEAISLVLPLEFLAVGQFYDDFHPVEDEEVIEILEGSRRKTP